MRQNNEQAIEQALDNGFDPAEQDNNHNALLSLGISHYCTENLYQKMLEKIRCTEDLNKQFGVLRRPLYAWALRFNSPGIVQLLLDKGASYTLCDEKKNTILHYMDNRVDTGGVKNLLDAGFDLNTINADGKTPIDVAIEKSTYILCHFFLLLKIKYLYCIKRCYLH